MVINYDFLSVGFVGENGWKNITKISQEYHGNITL